MQIVLLQPEKLTRDVLNVLGVLSETKSLDLYKAREILEYQKLRNHLTYVGYEDDKPIAIGSVILSDRLIHNGSTVALIEDVAVSKKHQRCGYGRQMIEYLTDIAHRYGCYKVILSCSSENEAFYIKCGYFPAQTTMRRDLDKYRKDE